MRKVSIFFAALFLTIFLAVIPVAADEAAKAAAEDTTKECKCKKKCDNLLTKLAWGLVDVIYAPAELIKVATCEPYDRGLAHDIPSNIGKGITGMTRRISAGAYNASTAPVPIPPGYKPIVKEEKVCCGMDNYEGGER
jgi:hypothetical protein